MPPKQASTARKRKSTAAKDEEPGSTSPPPPVVASKSGEDEQSKEEQAEDDEEEDDDDKPKKKAKKAAKPKEPVKPLDESLPINTTLPETLSFSRPDDGVVRITNWNVCGMKAAEKKGMRRYIEAEDADIVILSETKMADPGFDWLNDRYPHCYWGTDPKKGYAGTAILSKLEPLNVTIGLPTAEGDLSLTAGRIVTLEFTNSYVIGTYVPNAGAGLKEMPRKEAWNAAFEKYIRELDAKKPIIWGGDLNVVPTPEDVRNWKTNYEKSAGCTSKEIDAFNRQLSPEEGSGHHKLVDVWRRLHPDVIGHYSYYSLRFQCRVKGIGWRLDYAVVSERLFGKVKQCEIRQEVYGCSDHVPVVLDIEGPL